MSTFRPFFVLAVLVELIAAGCGDSREGEPVVSPLPGTQTTAPAGALTTGPAAAPAHQTAAIRRVHVFISGKVQGVGFRAFTRSEAGLLKVNGWVKNLGDGRVEAVFEGPRGNVATLLEQVRKGPDGSRVDEVEIEDAEPTGDFTDFEVRL